MVVSPCRVASLWFSPYFLSFPLSFFACAATSEKITTASRHDVTCFESRFIALFSPQQKDEREKLLEFLTVRFRVIAKTNTASICREKRHATFFFQRFSVRDFFPLIPPLFRNPFPFPFTFPVRSKISRTKNVVMPNERRSRCPFKQLFRFIFRRA